MYALLIHYTVYIINYYYYSVKTLETINVGKCDPKTLRGPNPPLGLQGPNPPGGGD